MRKRRPTIEGDGGVDEGGMSDPLEECAIQIGREAEWAFSVADVIDRALLEHGVHEADQVFDVALAFLFQACVDVDFSINDAVRLIVALQNAQLSDDVIKRIDVATLPPLRKSRRSHWKKLCESLQADQAERARRRSKDRH